MRHYACSRRLLLGLVLVAAIAGISIVATGSVAAQEVDVAASDLSGEGTQDNPYVITNASELQAMKDDLDAHYQLGNDIDAAKTATWNDGKGFDPVGEGPFSDNEFTGSLNGSDYTINNLAINRPNEDFVGLIGSTLPPSFSTESQGVITRLAVSNVNTTGNDYVGGIIGSNLGKINKSYVTGTISGNNTVGGLTGENMGEYNNGIITTSYAAVSVNGNNAVGGLSGRTWNGAPDPQSSFWDVNVSGQQASAGGTGLTTAEMTGSAAETNMSGLDFETVWNTQSDDYPVLASQTSSNDSTTGIFEVENLTVPSSVSQGDNISVGTTINNTGQTSLTQNITFSYSYTTGIGSAGGASYFLTTATVAGESEQQVSTDLTVPTDAESLTVEIATEDDTGSVTRTVDAASDEDSAIREPGDETPPEIHNAKLLNETVAPGDNLIIEINASDASDIIVGSVNFRKSQSLPYKFNDGVDSIRKEKFDRTGLTQERTRLEIPITETQVNGTYNLQSISMIDAAGNREYLSVGKDFLDQSVTVSNPELNPETTEPEVENIEILNDTVQPGEQLLLDVTASDQSTITEINAELELISSTYAIDFNNDISIEVGSKDVVQNGTTRLSLEIPESQLTGTYKIDSVEVTDEIGNTNYTSPAELKTVDVINGVSRSDQTEPELNNISISDSVTAGDNISIEMNVGDESRIVSATVGLEPESFAPYELPPTLRDKGKIYVEYKNNSGLGNTIQIKKSIPQDQFEGTYEIETVLIKDSARNQYSSGYNPQFDETVTVEEGVSLNVSKIDTNGPKISNVTIENTSLQAQEDLLGSVDITDESDVKTVSAVYRRIQSGTLVYDSSQQIKLSNTSTITSDGTVNLSTSIPEDAVSGQYQLTFVGATDALGNNGYDSDISPLTRISVKGEEPPTISGAEITSVELLNDSVAPGESAVLKIQTNNPVYISDLFLGFDSVPIEPNPGLVPTIPSESYDENFEIVETGSNITTVVIQIPETSPEGRMQLTSVASETPALSTYPRETLEIASTNNTDDGSSDATANATATVSGEDATVAPGENTTIEFSVTNTGDINSSYLLNLSLPDELTPVAYTNASGALQDGESKWLWETIEPGQTVSPTVTVRAPPEATGNHSIKAKVLTDEGVVSETNVTVTVSEADAAVSVPEAIDTNDNNEIDDLEVLTAIEYWETGESVPGTDGERIGDFEILDLIRQWRYNSQI